MTLKDLRSIQYIHWHCKIVSFASVWDIRWPLKMTYWRDISFDTWRCLCGLRQVQRLKWIVRRSTPAMVDSNGSISTRPFSAAISIREGYKTKFDCLAAWWYFSGCAIRNCRHSWLPDMTAWLINRYRLSAKSFSRSNQRKRSRFVQTFMSWLRSSRKDENLCDGCLHIWQTEQFAFNHLATSRWPDKQARWNALVWHPWPILCSHFTCAAFAQQLIHKMYVEQLQCVYLYPYIQSNVIHCSEGTQLSHLQN